MADVSYLGSYPGPRRAHGFPATPSRSRSKLGSAPAGGAPGSPAGHACHRAVNG